jgi:SAM-dependent methyltransferase
VGDVDEGALDLARCPITGQRLRLADAGEWWSGEWWSGERWSGGLSSGEPGGPGEPVPLGVGAFTPMGLVRGDRSSAAAVTADGSVAYPVLDGVALLLPTEAFGRGRSERFDIGGPHFAEAYAEAELYSAMAAGAASSGADHSMAHLVRVDTALRSGRLTADTFPSPPTEWLEAGSTIGAQYESFSHLAPVAGTSVLQIGGAGSHAVLFLLAGASRAVVVSPVVEELRQARRLADRVGVSDRLVVLGGVAECLPLADAGVDRVYSGSSMHHTVTSDAFAQIARVLRDDGRFASVDVWKAPLHGLGTKVFGKQGGNVHCHPLDPERVRPMGDAFGDSVVSFHGAFARYPLAVMSRLGRRPSRSTSWRLASAEDAWAARSSIVRRQSSLVVLRAADPRRSAGCEP